MVAQKNGSEHLIESTQGYFLGEDAIHEGNPQEMLDRGEKTELPPMLVVHGTADDNVPIQHVERFTASYKAAGGQITLEPFEGQPHGFANEPGPQSDRMVEVVKEYIARQLG